jgi:hypothetical protein
VTLKRHHVNAVPEPLTRRVLEYERTIKNLVPACRAPADWFPLAEFVAVESFERVGPFLEVQDWQQYTVMLTQWATAVDSFETTVRRVAELQRLVYFEVEERHFRGDEVGVVNTLTVFEFGDGDNDGKIRRLDVYLQQARRDRSR